MTKEDKYLAVQALEWFDVVKDRVWNWVFDEKQGYKHTSAITFFILGALVVYVVPDAPKYAMLAVVAIFALLCIFSCLILIGWFLEWALRKAFL